MTRMHKIAASLLAFILIVSLAACGGKDPVTSAAAPSAPESSSPAPETTAPAPSTEAPAPSTEAPAPSTGSSEPTPAPPRAPELVSTAVMHELEFGGVYLDMTIDDFNALGFEYGDSVTVTFSNGYELQDLPYYNGYYTVTGNPLLVAYPGYPYIKVCINNGDDLWKIAGLDENMTAAVRLREAGRYADIQDARDIHDRDDRDEFPSDEVFANFRAVRVSGLAENVLYRSASPCDNQHNRAPYVDALCKDAGIGYILNLADNADKITGYIAKDGFSSPYFLSLYEDGKVDPIGLNMNYGSADFRAKLTAGLRKMAEEDGPYLVHCTEGKDRTGFVCLLLEALCGASYEEIVDDYMITYDNYYQITKEEKRLLGAALPGFMSYYGLDTQKVGAGAARYTVIVENVLDPMVQSLAQGDPDFRTADLSRYAMRFLRDGGMSEAEILTLTEKLKSAPANAAAAP